MAKAQFVRYQTRDDAADENRRLIEAIFEELNRDDPGGLRNATFQLEDGVNFVHVAVVDEGSETLAKSPAFGKFVEGLGDRAVAPPAREEATLIGSYRFLGD
ncbi:hypothetical protein [Amycolatopsis sp. cmx-11-12]|uniref:hypothetical protein n=1 Tax=Amycolatopsis sp. cmx-11-12 TaxID=2785795 RepID=UPI00391809FC